MLASIYVRFQKKEVRVLSKKWFNLFIDNVENLREKKWDTLNQDTQPMILVKNLKKQLREVG